MEVVCLTAAQCLEICHSQLKIELSNIVMLGCFPVKLISSQVIASVNLPLHHKVQKFSSGTGSPGWSRKKGRKMVVVVVIENNLYLFALFDVLPSVV